MILMMLLWVTLRGASFFNFTSVISSSSITSIQGFNSIRPLSSCLLRRSMVEIGQEDAECTLGGKCLPCESLDKSHLLSPEQIETELAIMNLWSLKDGNKITIVHCLVYNLSTLIKSKNMTQPCTPES